MVDLCRDVKQVVVGFLDVSSFLSLCCTSREWNKLLSSLPQWPSHVQQHFETTWLRRFKWLSRRVDVSVRRFGRLLTPQECLKRDAALYKNGHAWLRLHKLRCDEIEKIALLDDFFYPSFTSPALKTTMKRHITTILTCIARMVEINIAIGETNIGWNWNFSKLQEKVLSAQKCSSPKEYLTTCAKKAARMLQLTALWDQTNPPLSKLEKDTSEQQNVYYSTLKQVCEEELATINFSISPET